MVIFYSISNSEELQAYKWECYRILYEHFHGAITGRKELLSEKAKAQLVIDKGMNTLDPDVAYQITQAEKLINQINGKLRILDNEVIEEEKTLFDS